MAFQRESVSAPAPSRPAFFAPALQLAPAQTLVTPATVTNRADFETVAARRYGVTTVRTGTQTEQESAITPHGTTTPIRIPGWQSWEPTGQDFQYIFDAFDDGAAAFGGFPAVREIVFFQLAYTATNAGVVTPEPTTGATYGAGRLTVYRRGTTAPAPLPLGRSVASGQYANVPVVTMQTTGSVPGAPIPWPSHAEGVRRTIAHELGHGLGEAALGGSNPASATDPAMMDDYRREVGWLPRADRLFDADVAAVRTALASGAIPPAPHEITPDHWNDPHWGEQPVSHYAVEGGAVEDFAESAMAYVYQPNVLLARSPRRYRFLDQRKSRWQANLRQLPPPVGDFPTPPRDRAYA